MSAVPQPSIDWFRVIVDLERADVSHEAIAFEVGRSKGWVAALKAGIHSGPKYQDGVRLLALWSSTLGRPPAEAPVEMPETVRNLR